jgi:uncharacterized membrane protein YhaH (DUF805 family)
MEEHNQYLYNYKPPAGKYSETSLFLIKGRITRTTYFRRLLYSLILLTGVSLLYFNQTTGKSLNELLMGEFDLFGSYLFLCCILFLLFILIQRVKRVHDLDKPGVYALIPFLVFLKGTEGDNNYGIDPAIKALAFFDQLKDQTAEEKPQNKNIKKHKTNLIVFICIGIITILLFGISQIRHSEALKSFIIPTDSIPGIYSVKHITFDTPGHEMYAEIIKNRISGFDIRVVNETGRQEYAFVRNEEGELFSEQLGKGKAVYSDLSELRNLVITFSTNNGSVWEFSKSN